MGRLDPDSLVLHADRLYRAAWSLCGSPNDAEDLVQETFARVLATPRELRGAGELPYLLGVLRNTFLTDRRTASRRPVSGGSTSELEPVDPRPHAALKRDGQAVGGRIWAGARTVACGRPWPCL